MKMNLQWLEYSIIYIMNVKELKDFIKDLPDETIVINNISGNEEVDLIYKKSTAYSDVLLIN